jgi:hypothetical protein
LLSFPPLLNPRAAWERIERQNAAGGIPPSGLREEVMKRGYLTGLGLMCVGLAALWHAQDASGQASGGWVTLFDGKNMDQWDKVGDANWKIEDGAAVADKGSGFLVSKNSYKDFEIKAEFWADENANSGIFIRCSDPKKITATNAYEVNIFDKRPDPSYGTGAIVNVAKVSPMPKAANKWNTYEIVAKGGVFTVTLNGQKTVDGVKDEKFASGPIALQRGAGAGEGGAGVIKFRLVQIKPL